MIDDKIKKIIKEYLDSCKLMNVSTLHNGKPRSFVCWFSVDKDFYFYFISSKESVHSLDIEKNSNVSVSIVSPIVSDLGVGGDGKFQGLMIEGNCKIIRGVDLVRGALSFVGRFPVAKEYIKMIGKSKVKLGETKIYRIVPRTGVWFDQVNSEEEKVELKF